MPTKHCEISPFCLGLASLSYHVNWLHYTTKKNLTNPYIPLCLPPPFPSLSVPLCLSCWISSAFVLLWGNKENKRKRGDSMLLIYCSECVECSFQQYCVLDRLDGLVVL